MIRWDAFTRFPNSICIRQSVPTASGLASKALLKSESRPGSGISLATSTSRLDASRSPGQLDSGEVMLNMLIVVVGRLIRNHEVLKRRRHHHQLTSVVDPVLFKFAFGLWRLSQKLPRWGRTPWPPTTTPPGSHSQTHAINPPSPISPPSVHGSHTSGDPSSPRPLSPCQRNLG